MNFKIFIILFCLVAGNVNARQVITGKIADKESLKSIESANVELLLLPDSTAVESVKTNSEGLFVFYKGDTAKRYCLRIKHLSYMTMILPVAKRAGMINNMGAITLSPAVISLKEITVGSSKIRVTELPDRTVYTIPEGVKKTSTDGLDVLRKIPSLQVDYFNENITVEGKTNIKIEVDGVTRDKEYLKKLHPSQISKLELNTSPSGKYDAETDAVINIITNKEMRYGLKGMINAMVLPHSSDAYVGFFNANLDYGMEKISYYAAVNGGTVSMPSLSSMDRMTGNSFLHTSASQSSKGYNGNINVGFIFDPDKLNNVNFNVSYNGNKQKGESETFNFLSENNILNRIYKSNANSDNTSGGLNTNLYYKHIFDKKGDHKIEVEATYYNSLHCIGSNTNFQNINYSLDTIEGSRGAVQTEESNTDKQTFKTSANYFLPFDSVYTFGTGVSGNYNQYNIDNIRSLSNSPNLDYKDMRESFFAEISRIFKKGSIKIGSRVEASQVTINSTTKAHYISPLPYTNIQYKINSKNSVKLAYTRRVIRPSTSDLNPFESVVDSLTITHGNSDLKPAYRDNFQLSYSLRYGNGKFTGTLSPQVFYEYRTGLIQRITQAIPNTNRTENFPKNISDGYETGLGMSLNSQIAMVMVNSYLRYSYNHVDKYLDQISATNKKGWNWNIYAMTPLPYKLSFFTVFNISSPYVNGQTETKSSAFYLLGLTKQFKNNSSLRIMAFNPFANKLFDNITTLRGGSVYQRTDSYMNMKNAIMLNYTYSFKLGKEVNAQKRATEQETDESNGKTPFKF